MERTLIAFVWKHSRAAQIAIVLLSALTIPIVYLSLEVPKQIIDEAIQGTDFPKEVFGVEFSQTGYLFTLCALFLLLVVLINVLKYFLNIKKGLTGERMLRRLRYAIYRRSLLTTDERTLRRPPAETTQMITAEVEPIGNFMGDVMATPVFQGSTLLVYIVFIFLQDPFLGLAAIAMYPVQAFVVPMIQKRVIARTQDRLRSIRAMTGELTESLGARSDIVGYTNTPWHLSQISSRLFFNFKMRFAIFRLKFLIKFFNNFSAQLTPFFFYSYGGYLVITGGMPIGSLVAVLAAYKDLSGPWKELLTYYQTLSDMRARYRIVVAPFAELEEREIAEANTPISGPIEFDGVRIDDTTGDGALEGVSFPIPAQGITAIVGDEMSGRITALRALAGRAALSSGRIAAEEQALDAGRLVSQIAYASTDAPIFRQNMRFNLAYSALTEPEAMDDADGRLMQREAQETGSVPGDLRSPWFEGNARDDDRLIEIADRVGLSNDLYRLGLQSTIDPDDHPALVERILIARAKIRAAQQSDETLRDRVSFWEPDGYNVHADFGSNLVFHAHRWTGGDMVSDPAILAFLKDDAIGDEVCEIGAEVSEKLLSVFENITKDKELISQFGLFSDREVPAIQRAIRRMEKSGSAKLRKADRILLTRVAFGYCSARHRLGVMRKEGRMERTLEARKRLREHLDGNDGFVSFDAENYIASLSVSDNLLNGKVNRERGGSWPPVETAIDDASGGAELRALITRVGLDAEIGEDRVNSAQRRRIAVARALASERPFIVVEGFANSDPDHDPELKALLDCKIDKGIVLGLDNVNKALSFGADYVVSLDQGQLQKEGPAAAMQKTA